MGILQRFDPPAHLPDLYGIAGQLDAWHRAVSSRFDASIDMDRQLASGGVFQFYNSARFDPAGSVVEQAIMESRSQGFAGVLRMLKMTTSQTVTSLLSWFRKVICLVIPIRT